MLLSLKGPRSGLLDHFFQNEKNVVASLHHRLSVSITPSESTWLFHTSLENPLWVELGSDYFSPCPDNGFAFVPIIPAEPFTPLSSIPSRFNALCLSSYRPCPMLLFPSECLTCMEINGQDEGNGFCICIFLSFFPACISCKPNPVNNNGEALRCWSLWKNNRMLLTTRHQGIGNIG